MNILIQKARRFLVSEDGPTAVEYAVMLALIIVVCLTAIQAIGTNANATFQSVAAKMPTGVLLPRNHGLLLPVGSSGDPAGFFMHMKESLDFECS